MSKPRTTIPREVQQVLDGLPWEAVRGSKHIKLLLAGKLICVFPQSPSSNNWRSDRNALRCVIRAVETYRSSK